MNIAWTIAASDSSAGAGIEADLAAFANFNVHGCSIITKITAQNTKQIHSSHTIPPLFFKEQLSTLYGDLKPEAIKISVLGSVEQLNILTKFLSDYKGYTIYDPVLISSTGSTLTNENLISTIKNTLLPKLCLITPNIPEAEALTNIKIVNKNDIIKASKKLLDFGVKNVLIKGGHSSNEYASDYFVNNNTEFWLTSKRDSKNVHGTGCHLSSAITANLAFGNSISDSIIIAKRYINSAIRQSYKPVDDSIQYYIPQYDLPYNSFDMPMLYQGYSDIALNISSKSFLECGNLGLYVIVESSNLVEKLCKYGVKTIQLRIKDINNPTLESEIIKSIKIAKQYDVKLFINDYWALAIKHNAYGVHLGQEDLEKADINAIKESELRLGISSHCHYELARAISLKPSYIALGPIYPTVTKDMPWAPQGLDKIKEWQKIINCPLVVIGGINLQNIDKVIKAGATNIALVSAINKASNIGTTIKKFLKKFQI